MRRIATMLGTVALGLSLVIPATPALAGTSATSTIVRRVRPIGADGTLEPDYRVVRRARGRCWTSSIASQQRVAFRCLQDNLILDPCFASTPHVVYCMKDPWTHRVVRLRIRRLPSEHNAGIRRLRTPWGMELAGGRHCVLGTGTAAWVGRTALPYICSSGYATEPRLSSTTRWHVRVAPEELDRLRRRAVAVALF
jgi:hypothetical protein